MSKEMRNRQIIIVQFKHDLLLIVIIQIKDIKMAPPKDAQTDKTPQEPKPSASKKQIFGDIVTFFSIVNAYLFISITLNYDIFEGMVGLSLDNPSFIIFLFLSYTAFIFTIQGFAQLLEFLSKKQGITNNTFVATVNNDIRVSLTSILAIVSCYIFVHTFLRPLSIEEFCHVAFWLWIAEAGRMFGTFFGRLTGIYSLSYWGRSMEIMLLLGGLLEAIGWGIFVLF